ncbi:HAD family hydrolase [Natronospirillum operosum]|nr:HAD family phosphatase [Natronospirillum operosum]
MLSGMHASKTQPGQRPTTHIVFDMGGVLVDIQWQQKIGEILGQDIPFDQMHQLWGNSRAAEDFETGQINFATFSEQFRREFALNLDHAEFERLYAEVIRDEFPGTGQLLDHLGQHFELGLLSNINPYHWAMVEQRPFLAQIPHVHTSLTLGYMKPDPRIYRALLHSMQAEPEQVLFFDDGLINVEAARAEGMDAEQVFGPDDIEQALRDRGLWP